MYENDINRFKELLNYNPSKGIINEGWGDLDTTGWVCVGEVAYSPWLNGAEKVYVMVNPQKTMKYGEEINEIRYTENPDGSGRQTDVIPVYARKKIVIYPEHRNDEFGELFLGKKKDSSTIEQTHNEFVSKLFKNGGNVIIHHNSPYVVRDGIIKKGKANLWSNPTDSGIYFWGSRNGGKDPSNDSSYTYYCIVPQNDIYDFETNEERLTMPQAMEKYPYVGHYWPKDNDVVVIRTNNVTPIWCILDKNKGKWYDKDWNEIEKPF